MEQERIDKNIDLILDGKDPDKPDVDFRASKAVLQDATTAELEELLGSPEIGVEENEAIREQALEILTLRLGPDYVANLMDSLRDKDSPFLMYVTSYEKDGEGDRDKSKAMQAKEKLAELHCPLAEIIPYHVMTFIMDPNGTFYIRLEQDEVVHLKDFDLILSEEMSGIMEEDYAYQLHGITGMAQVQNSVIEFKVNEFQVDRTNVTMLTDHPIARVVTVHMDQFIFAIMTTYAPEN